MKNFRVIKEAETVLNEIKNHLAKNSFCPELAAIWKGTQANIIDKEFIRVRLDFPKNSGVSSADLIPQHLFKTSIMKAETESKATGSFRGSLLIYWHFGYIKK